MKLGLWAFSAISAVTGNLVATLHPGELNGYAKKLVDKVTSLQELYYAAETPGSGINYEEACKAFKGLSERANEDGGMSIANFYYAASFSVTPTGGKCKMKVKQEHFSNVEGVIKNPSNLAEAFQALIIQQAFNQEYSGEEKLNQLIELVKADDSVLAGALAIKSAVALWRKNKEFDISPLLNVIDIDDLFAQADTAKNQVSFNNDIAVTCMFVEAAYDLSAYRESSILSADQLIGFGNFAAAGVRPETHQEIFYYSRLVSLIANGPSGSPIKVALLRNTPINNLNNMLAVEVTDLYGSPRGLKLSARSITRLEDNEVVLSNVEFGTPDVKDNNLVDHPSKEITIEEVYILDFWKESPKAGWYEIELEAVGERVLLSDDAIRLKFKVSKSAKITAVRSAIGTKKLGSKLTYTDGEFEEEAKADVGSKVSVSFVVESVLDQEAITTHQAFVTLANAENGQTVTFIAEPDANLVYYATFDVKEHLEFNGKYFVSVSVGDEILYPGMLTKKMGEIDITGLKEAPIKGAWSRKYLAKFDPKEELSHTFREPEPRPPVIISLVFTALCALPMAGLLIAWKAMGINVNKMESSYLPFHVSIASVFGLYFLYWYKLNMFTTLKYLALLGSVTFILGNKVLSALATPEASPEKKKN